MRLHHVAASLLLALPIAAGCKSDDTLNSPNVVDPMFRRYAALGNSITAGFQSAGINDSTQLRAYPALLAAAMGTSFTFPTLSRPGCPPPFTNNVTQARVGNGTATTCAGNAVPHELLNNLGVPGNAVGTLLSNFAGSPSAFDPLKTIMLGGRTEVELMMKLQPTFVTVFIGSNDILGAFISLTNAGDSTQITPVPQFTADFDKLADSVTATGANVAVVSVANVTYSPFASPAAIYYCLKNADPVCTTVVNPPIPQNPILGNLATFTVTAACAPQNGGFTFQVPWPIALGKVQAAAGGTPSSLDCADQPSVIGPEEMAAMQTAITGYNQHIQSVAQARGWAYLDINPPFAQLKAQGQIPVFPDVSGVFIPPPQGPLPITFGPIFSLDGIHLSSTGQRMIADSLASVINQTFGTSLPVPVCGTVTCPVP